MVSLIAQHPNLCFASLIEELDSVSSREASTDNAEIRDAALAREKCTTTVVHLLGITARCAPNYEFCSSLLGVKPWSFMQVLNSISA